MLSRVTKIGKVCKHLRVRKVANISNSDADMKSLLDARNKSDNEEVIIVDDNNNIIDYVSRKTMRQNGLLHRSSYILVFMSQYNNKLLIQKRVLTKDYCPGYFDVTTGGVNNKNETETINAYKELNEELGINNVELIRIKNFMYKGNNNAVIGTLWKCYFNGYLHDISIQKEEVDSIYLKSINEIKDEYYNKNIKYTKDSIHALEIYLDSINKL